MALTSPASVAQGSSGRVKTVMATLKIGLGSMSTFLFAATAVSGLTAKPRRRDGVSDERMHPDSHVEASKRPNLPLCGWEAVGEGSESYRVAAAC